MNENNEENLINGPIPIAEDNPGIARIQEKCIKCGLCSKICQNNVGVKYDPKKSKGPVCLSCGQCVLNCPVGALVPKYQYREVMNYIADTEKVVIALTSPAVRVALGESFNSPEVNVEGKMVAAIKELGFDYVLDTTFGADLTIMEEANELIERIESGKNLPQFTSCCPAWVRYVEIYHPELIDNLSTAKSPISMQTAMIKSYFAEMMDIPREKIVTVAVAPCTSKKLEAKIHPETDYVITTQELSLMIKEKEINFNELQPAEFDPLMQRGSGGGVIFGSSGGVTESALRAVYYFLTKKEPPEHLLDFKEVRGYDNIKEAEVVIDNLKLHVLVAHGLTNIEKVISDLKEHKKQYDFIEVMNCPGGCVGGGGQPLGITSKQQESNEKRQQGLYEEDRNLKLRNCYANPEIIDIYRSYLGYPLSEKAELLLHTEYKDESGILGE